MEQMILSKKTNKQTNKNQKQIVANESRLGIPRKERGGSVMDGHLGFFLSASRYICNGWSMGSYCTVREMCVIESLCCITELDETLEINSIFKKVLYKKRISL